MSFYHYVLKHFTPFSSHNIISRGDKYNLNSLTSFKCLNSDFLTILITFLIIKVGT